jgi:hypothetical protein
MNNTVYVNFNLISSSNNLRFIIKKFNTSKAKKNL